jgi:hypothetical protein
MAQEIYLRFILFMTSTMTACKCCLNERHLPLVVLFAKFLLNYQYVTDKSTIVTRITNPRPPGCVNFEKSRPFCCLFIYSAIIDFQK